MHPLTHKFLLLFAVSVPVFLISLGYLFFTYQPDSSRCVFSGGHYSELPSRGVLTAGSTTIAIEMAKTQEESERGLSHRPSIGKGTGMLFLFDHADQYAFWMPGMCFAIDIVWIDEGGRIVDVTHNATPESYPTLFKPKLPAKYVLEVGAGEADVLGLTPGIVVEFHEVSQR